MRICQPVSQSPSSVLHAVHAAEQKHDRHQEGEIRQRRQQLDRELGRLRFHMSIHAIQELRHRLSALPERAAGRETTENPCNSRAGPRAGFSGPLRDPRHRALAVNALLAEAVIGRQLDFDGHDLPQRPAAAARPSSPRQATSIPLRLMFSVYIALRIQSAGDVTWHRSLISIRGLSRRLMFFIALLDTGEFSAASAAASIS